MNEGVGETISSGNRMSHGAGAMIPSLSASIIKSKMYGLKDKPS